MTAVAKSINQNNFITDWPNRRIIPPIVKYTLRDTEIHFQHSTIVEHIRNAFDAFYTKDELTREAERRNSLRAVRMPIYIEAGYRNHQLLLRCSKIRIPNSIEHIVCFHQTEGGWKYTGYLVLKFREHFTKIAKLQGWERGVYLDKNGPTRNPDFHIACSQFEILITAPFGNMPEDEFRKKFKLGAPQKPRIAKTRY